MLTKHIQRGDGQICKASVIKVKGLVQGVGFRPFIYRLARQFALRGWVENRTDGVLITIIDSGEAVNPFLEALKAEAPHAADIESVELSEGTAVFVNDFTIRESSGSTDEITEIGPDIAVCGQCLSDMKEQPHRIDYPLINCTNCGPRFTIIKGLPYDRPLTTMEPFAMCDICAGEYSDVNDRRFHAQPVACNNCGPRYQLVDKRKSLIIPDFEEQLKYVAERLSSGEIVAIKGTGGYHLICDALNPEAISRLRDAKKRDGKPFAVMFHNIDELRKYAAVSAAESVLLTSWRRPVVLLPLISEMSPLINSNLNTIGAILPYMPVHHLLFGKLPTKAIVFTSGNISDEPVEISDEKAMKRLEDVASVFFFYNREIFNRADDSVVRVISGNSVVIRRSRGYVPKPVALSFNADTILATGAELKSTFAIGKGSRAILSQHIGDLKNHETYEFYLETYSRFSSLFRFRPELVAADLHPDYLSTHFAETLGVPVEYVQHHHAHIASCMAEHGLDEPVVGLAFDGTGLGDDGTIWGSELMLADLGGYERKGHLENIALPGGDKTAEEPWRIAFSLLYDAYGNDALNYAQHLMPGIPTDLLKGVRTAIEKRINISYSAGIGRLFDGVAALTGLCTKSAFEAECPMRLEAAADIKETGVYQIDDSPILNSTPIIRGVIDDLMSDVSVGLISARFHNTIIEFAVNTTIRICKENHIRKVVLSGGSFQNRILAEKISNKLRNHKLSIFMQTKVPCNDGGISLGQLAIAAKRRNLLCV